MQHSITLHHLLSDNDRKVFVLAATELPRRDLMVIICKDVMKGFTRDEFDETLVANVGKQASLRATQCWME